MERIVIIHHDAQDTPVIVEREVFYADPETYMDYGVAVVDSFIFTSSGDLLLQKRARHKSINPGKLHTSVGGHLNPGQTTDVAMLVECLEEIGVPCSIAHSDEEFASTVPLLSSFTDRLVYFQPVKEYFVNIEQDDLRIKSKMYRYYGIYNGPVQTVDRTVSGFERLSLAEVEEELEAHPEYFTGSFAYYRGQQREDIYRFVEDYCQGV